MRNLILIQICQSDVTFKPTFDHFLKLCILAGFGCGHKVAQVEIAQMGPPWFPLVNVIRKFLSALIGHV